MSDTFSTGEDFQELLLACILRHPDQFAAYVPVIKPGFFTGVQSTLVARCMVDYYRERSRFPSFTVLRELAVSAAKGITDNAQHAALVKDFVDKVERHNTGDYQFVRDHTLKFVKEQSVVSTMREAIALLKEGKIPPDGFSSMFAKAIDVGSNLEDLGYLLHQDSDKVVDYVSNETYGISTGYPLLDKVWRNGWGPGWLVVPLAPPKRYKCLRPDTRVIMFDGTIRRIDEVRVGDQLMGDDSTPRNVSACGSGHGPMYRVEQLHGMTYECNDAHILCLTDAEGNTAEMTAEEFYELSKNDKDALSVWRGYAAEIEYQRSALERGKASHSKRRRLNSRKLKITPIGDGEWFGVTIDGNRKFLLEDCTVTHNTGFSINIALNMVSPAIGEHVFYYACEISQELAMMRALCNLARQPFEAAIDSPERFKQAVKHAMADRVAAHCLFKSFASKSSTIDDIRAHARSAISQLGFKPRVIVIDYAETIKPSDKRDQEYRQQSSIYTEARALGTELGCTIIMPDRCNRETVSKPVPNFTSFQGAFEKAGIVDVAIGLCVRSDQKVVTNLGLISIGHLGRFVSAGKEVLALSHNFTTGKDEWKPIVNWFDNGESDQPFIRVKTDAASPYSVFQESKPMFVTPDHHVFRPDGTKVRARDLCVGDKISVRFGEASVTSLELAPVSAQKRARWKVDIEVADNHNYYLASGTLVSNCATESEHMNNTLRTFVFLNRHGAPFQHLRGRVDPQTWRIELTEEIPYDPDADDGDDSGSDKKRRRKSRDRGPVDDEI